MNKPKHNSPEMVALNDLLKTMNDPNIPGVFVPPGVDTAAVVPAPNESNISPTPYTPPDEPKDLSKDIKKLRAAERATKLAAKGPAGAKGVDGDPGTAGTVHPESQARADSRAAEFAAATRLDGVASIVVAPPPKLTIGRKLFFTGRISVGKDTSATSAGAVIFGFADPLYAIASYYFGVTINSAEGKDLPGVRTFLQIIGHWGRGVVSEAYPLTVARGLLTQQVRRAGAFGFPEVDWASYGNNPDIWLDACIKRADQFFVENPDKTVAITNCRFADEFKRLQSAGWEHWHCMCSPKTWADRLALSKLTPESPAVKDVSEQLAASLDANVTKQISATKQGPKLRCIWSDKNAPPPSDRLHTIESFLQSIKGVV